MDFGRHTSLGRDPSKRDSPQDLDELQFSEGLIQFRAPFRGEAKWVSFPPHTNMLTFGGESPLKKKKKKFLIGDARG